MVTFTMNVVKHLFLQGVALAKDIDVKGVAKTKGCLQKANIIYYIKYGIDEMDWASRFQLCLQMAQQDRVKTLAIPVFESGNFFI